MFHTQMSRHQSSVFLLKPVTVTLWVLPGRRSTMPSTWRMRVTQTASLYPSSEPLPKAMSAPPEPVLQAGLRDARGNRVLLSLMALTEHHLKSAGFMIDLDLDLDFELKLRLKKGTKSRKGTKQNKQQFGPLYSCWNCKGVWLEPKKQSGRTT